eukprot:Ihof_evm1s632 gene=Ihof_evmTU1s632
MSDTTTLLIYDRVRLSCKEFLSQTNLVKINDEKIEEFVKSTSQDEITGFDPLTHLPLKMENLDQEINIYALMNILNFASGFRQELHAAIGRGAYETITYGIMSLALQGNPLDANALLQLTLHDVATNFGFPISREKQVAVGVYMEEPTELRKLAELIMQCLHEVGQSLKNIGLKTLSQFIVRAIDPARGPDDLNRPMASSLIDALIKNFPAFDDRVTVDGVEVFLIKKAQLLCSDFYVRFGERDPERFAFKDYSKLTIFADNVVPAMLRHLGVIELHPSLLAKIEAKESLPAAGPEHTALRAASVVACDRIVE